MLLAAAAFVAAAIGAYAAVVSSRATGSWQIAVRRQVTQADDLRRGLEGVYLTETPAAFSVFQARLRAEELRTAADGLAEPDRDAVLARASAEADLADRLAAGESPLATDPAYLAPDGLDVGRRLGQVRGSGGAHAAPPAAWVAKGDGAGREAVAMTAGTIPVGVAFLLGALSGVFPARRRHLVTGGVVSLGVAVAWVAGVAVSA